MLVARIIVHKHATVQSVVCIAGASVAAARSFIVIRSSFTLSSPAAGAIKMHDTQYIATIS